MGWRYSHFIPAVCAAGVLAIAVFVAMTPVDTHAQFLDQTIGTYLDVTPSFPEPGEEITVSLQAYSLNLGGATIRWFVDGTPQTDAVNSREIVLTVGSLGVPTPVRAEVTLADGVSVPVTTTITPTALDLIVEANTRVPPFYRGRALPAGREEVTVIAVPHLPDAPDPKTLTYKWSLGTKVLFGGPVYGKMRASFDMSERSQRLLVEVQDGVGNTVAEEGMMITPVRPTVRFYEINPLRGTLERAIGKTHTLVGQEITVRAEPYFVGSGVVEQSATIDWSIGNEPVETTGPAPEIITLRAEGGSGRARVGFALTNPDALLQSVRDSFTIIFE